MQQTIINITQFEGKGLHTGTVCTVVLLPAAENTGIKFRRVDLKNKPYIHATVQNVVETNRRTVLEENGATIETTEHILAALFALSISNIIIEINGPELPILDGGSALFIKELEKAGIKKQMQKNQEIAIPYYFKVETEDNSKIEFFPNEKLEIEVKINYKSNVLQPQKATLSNLNKFKDEISNARTFCFLHELNELINRNLIKGGNLETSIVFVEEEITIDSLGDLKKLLPQKIKKIHKGVLNPTPMMDDNEQAKHKLLDLLGDIALAGCKIKGKIVAYKPGHKINTLFTKKLIDQLEKKKDIMDIKPLMKINEIKKILPHREPFLFIDEIRELNENFVTGIKYVTKDEYYFKGHFPGAPVMPGVLQIEAMAQTGGILALNSVPDPENYLTYFMKIDRVKFKKKVEPDCVLIFKLNLLSPIRRGICHMQATAYVNNEIVTEAELMAKIVKEKA